MGGSLFYSGIYNGYDLMLAGSVFGTKSTRDWNFFTIQLSHQQVPSSSLNIIQITSTTDYKVGYS